MPNPHGTPIWYELLSADADASRAFYEAVLGWTVHMAPPGGVDYRMIDTGDGLVGGLMALSAEMQAAGAKPAWLFYLGVDDVDAAVAAITAKGGAARMGPFDIEGVGRMALVADPQGMPFYVMRGSSEASSTAFDRTGTGKGNWNELNTPDQASANAFYADVFGWTYPDKLSMGPVGDYVFVSAGDQGIGATMPVRADGPPAGWIFYFGVPDLDAAAATLPEAGGTLVAGPMDVPGGERILVARDPHGMIFGLVGRHASEGAAA